MERGTAHNATGLFCLTCAFLSYFTGCASGLSSSSKHITWPKHHKSIPARHITYFAYQIDRHRETVGQHPSGVKRPCLFSFHPYGTVRGRIGTCAHRETSLMNCGGSLPDSLAASNTLAACWT